MCILCEMLTARYLIPFQRLFSENHFSIFVHSAIPNAPPKCQLCDQFILYYVVCALLICYDSGEMIHTMLFQPSTVEQLH